MEVPAGFMPSGLRDAPTLLDPSGPAGDGTNAALRLARLTAASLAYALEAPTAREAGAHPQRIKQGGYTERLLTKEERLHCEAWSNEDPSQRVCHYCQLLGSLFHANGQPVEAEVVNHGARIQTDFDASTNIASARIEDYMVFVPEELAPGILKRSHPLEWKNSADDLFEMSVAAARSGEKPEVRWDPAPDITAETWETKPDRESDKSHPVRYLYEIATWPWNDQVTSKIENVIRIIDFDPSPYALSYKYALESCIRSSYGIAWEEHGGLNIDDGEYEGRALSLGEITPEDVERLDESSVDHLVGALTRRLAAYGREDNPPWYLANHVRHEAEKLVALLKPDGKKTTQGRVDMSKLEIVKSVGLALETLWGRPVRLLIVTAGKRLRYTVPSNGSVDLWALLTYLAPGLLFMFINRAVCQIPYFAQLAPAEASDDVPLSKRVSQAPPERLAGSPGGPPPPLAVPPAARKKI